MQSFQYLKWFHGFYNRSHAPRSIFVQSKHFRFHIYSPIFIWLIFDMHLINIKFSFQKPAFCKKSTFSIFFYSLSFLSEAYINLFEILHIVNIESRDSQKFAFEKKRYYHDSNISSFKFFKSSSSQLHGVQCLFELFEIHLHLNYPNLIFT